jgi:hypothetical protein
MEKKTRAKLIIVTFLILGIAFGLSIRWRTTEWDPSWGKGNLTVSERNFYIGRIGRIIDSWSQTARKADTDIDGRLKETYRNCLVIDLDKKSLWIEDRGQIQQNTTIEFPAGLKWNLYHSTPQGKTELTGRSFLRFRGTHTSRLTPEFFCLAGQSRRSGHICFHFNGRTKVSDYGAGKLTLKSYQFDSVKNSENLYGSLIVTEDERQQYRDFAASLNISESGEQSVLPDNLLELEENKAAWNRIEKFLYMEIDQQVHKAGYGLRNLTVKPGPDFSAGHAEIRGNSKSVLHKILGGSSSVESYLNIDYLGNNIWYAKSEAHPLHPIMPRRELELEFLICSEKSISNSKEKEFLTKGRQKQQQFAPVPETPWKVTLSNGTTVEFIGICENPSAGKQWWGPDGSLLDYVPYINVESYGRSREDRKIYEFAWRIQRSAGSGATRYSMEGSKGSYGKQIRDRYGNRIIEGLSAEGYGFDTSHQKTSWELGFTDNSWKTALTIEDAAGETKFLGKQRILLNPPTIENGQIVIRCYEEYGPHVRDYQTDFGLIYRESSAIKTVSLDRYEKDTMDNRDTGLTEHTFIIDKLDIHQIEGVCFRYRPFEFVKFKNISLVPGKNQGFEIELGKR